MDGLVVYYSCHCEWGERKALPAIVCRGRTDAETTVILQLSPLSPLVSHRLFENEPNGGHLAGEAAYSWSSSCRDGADRAQTLSFWTNCTADGHICRPGPRGSHASHTLNPIFRSPFFLLQQAARKLIASSLSSARPTIPKLRFFFLFFSASDNLCHQRLNTIRFKP